MKLKCLTYATVRLPGLDRLTESLTRHGWAFEVLGLGEEWTLSDQDLLPFGRKMTAVRDVLPRLKTEGVGHVLFTDAFDVLCFGTPTEAEAVFASHTQWQVKALASCECACWPDVARESDYPQYARSRWKHINSGGYLGEIDFLGDVVLAGVLNEDDDQRHLTSVYLNRLAMKEYDLARDDRCELFQSFAHSSPPEQFFEIRDGRPRNTVTGTSPLFWHGNGRTDMAWLEKL